MKSKRDLQTFLSSDGLANSQQSKLQLGTSGAPFNSSNKISTANLANNDTDAFYNSFFAAELLEMKTGRQSHSLLSLSQMQSQGNLEDVIPPSWLAAEREKAEKNRERNRAHAKKTRLRKKEMMETMKQRLMELQKESARLEQLVEEKNTANILLTLCEKNSSVMSNGCSDLSLHERESPLMMVQKGGKGNIIDQLRLKVRMEAAVANGAIVAGKSEIAKGSRPESTTPSHSHLSQKSKEENGSGVQDGEDHSCDTDSNNEDTDLSVTEDEGKTSPHGNMKDVESMKKERNRLHAKRTRDRKKLFANKMQQTIAALENHIQSLRKFLQDNLSPSSSF